MEKKKIDFKGNFKLKIKKILYKVKKFSMLFIELFSSIISISFITSLLINFNFIYLLIAILLFVLHALIKDYNLDYRIEIHNKRIEIMKKRKYKKRLKKRGCLDEET